MAPRDELGQLATYVPTPVARAIYQQPHILTQPATRRFPAAVLFSDISGFTALSELLAEAGPTGAEELTHLINRYFTRMIEISQTYRGQVVRFSGDALTVLFPAENVSMVAAIRRAAECALVMQSQMVDFEMLFTSRGQATLSMKVGIGAGEILECSVGGVFGRWDYVVAGAPLIQVAMAEQEAGPGQTILSAEAWHLAKEFFAGEPLPAHNCIRLRHVLTPLPPLSPLVFNWSELGQQQTEIARQALESFVPDLIRAHLHNQSHWLAELRRMTVVFVGVSGLDYQSPNPGDPLQNFVQAVQELVGRFEGALNKVAVDDKGTVLLILFGAPPHAHEDNPARAVAFALELQSVAAAQQLRLSIGIAEGTLFAGPVGAPDRREYTVIGDTVNLAARLMQYGRAGSTLISDRVQAKIEPNFATESLGHINLKGKAQAQLVYRVKGEQDAREEFVMRYLLQESPLVGRTAEMAQIRQVMQKTQAGSLQLLIVEGELGLGKSRLASELAREWLWAGGVGYGGRCISYNRQSAYRVWREVFAAMYALTGNLSPQRRLARLAAGIAKLADPPGEEDYWVNRLPLLAEVLGLEILDNGFTKTLSGKLRRNNTFAMVEALLRQEIEHRPVLILLEDLHWADELSLSLATYLAEKMSDTPLLLAFVHRPLPTAQQQVLTSLTRLVYTHTITLQPLSSQESLEFVRPLLGNIALDREGETILLDRGQGNPFYLQELATAITRTVRNNPYTTIAALLDGLNLSDNLHDVVLSRVSRLAESERLTLKVASVIGDRFQRAVLEAIHPAQPDGLALSIQLSRLETEKLVRLKSVSPKHIYDFFNVIIQEVVYEGLLLSQRRQLHTAVADTLEELWPDDVEQLAFHYRQGQNRDKALHYLNVAAAKSRHEFANNAAIEYYSQILNLLELPSLVEGLVTAEYWLAMLARAQLYALTGQHDQELNDLETLGLLAEVADNNSWRALVAKQWANFYQSRGDYDSGMELIERWVVLAQQADVELLSGEGYNAWGKLRYLRGELSTATAYLHQALQIAQKHDARHLQADCLNSLGLVAHYQEDFEVAHYFFQEAVTLWQSLGDRVGLGDSLNNLGQVHFDLGQYAVAQQHYDKALTLYTTVGDRAGAAQVQLSLGCLLRTLGDYNQSRLLLSKALTTHRVLEDSRSEAGVLASLGFLYCRLADYEQALAFLDEAQVLLDEIEDVWIQGNVLTYRGWILTELQEFEPARHCFEQAITLQQKTQQGIATAEDTAHLGRVAFLQGNLSLALDKIETVLDFVNAHDIAGLEHPVRCLLTCYEVLHAVEQTERALHILEKGYRRLMNHAAQIADEQLRQTYLTAIPEHQHLQELAKVLLQA